MAGSTKEDTSVVLNFTFNGIVEDILTNNAIDEDQLFMVNPEAYFDERTLTITTKPGIGRKKLFQVLEPKWIFPVTKTQYRFAPKQDLEQLVQRLRDSNANDYKNTKKSTFFRLMNDRGEMIQLNTKTAPSLRKFKGDRGFLGYEQLTCPTRAWLNRYKTSRF